MYTPVYCFEQKAGGKRLYLIDPLLAGLPEIEGMTKRIFVRPLHHTVRGDRSLAYP